MSGREWTDEEKKEFISGFRAKGTRFVRSCDQLAEDKPEATGLRMTLDEVLDAFGTEVIPDLWFDGSAILVCDMAEPGRTIKGRREFLKLDVETVAYNATVTPRNVLEVEHNARGISIHIIIKIAKALGLNPKYISWKAGKPELGYLYEED